MEKKEGVYIIQKKNGQPSYRSSVTYRQKHISLGSFPSPEAAHAAYLTALFLLRENLYATLSDYRKESPLPFEKWVLLLNFRDNNMYFHTPIYVRHRFFYYYYSPECILKFDIDDLFYFSSHKIMKRGGHYFVADFGMQTNILNRYGIKNYAVPGRDYLFLNQDPTDFRRENLVILNRYHGVIAKQERNTTRYLARLHVRGNYVIGTYDTVEEAAIAYNKAIDTVRQNGCRKNFTPNFLENISAGAYAELYTRLPISEKIKKLTFPNNQ